MRFCRDHIEIDDHYAKCMTISWYPRQLDDKFISTLLQQVPYVVLSITIQPVETEDAYQELDDSRMKTDAEKVRFNRKTVENLDFVATVPYKTQAQEKNIEYIVDPENEYAPLVKAMGGEVVDISPVSKTHFNPLDFKYNKDTGILPQNEKSEFVLSLFEKIMEPQNVMPGDKSLVDACLKNIYQPLINSNYTIACPTLVDLWEELQRQREPRAQQLALALQLFATGSMKTFAQPTNIDMSNRLICFNINRLGKQLKPVAMLSMLEFINTTVMNNDRTDAEAGTWVYFDEIYLLLRDEQSAVFLNESWKRYRKYNAFATGITQNVTDCTANPTARAILSNSEFLVLMLSLFVCAVVTNGWGSIAIPFSSLIKADKHSACSLFHSMVTSVSGSIPF